MASKTKTENPEELLSITKCARVMGVTPKIMMQIVKEGKIKTMQWGKEARIPRHYLTTWQNEQLHKSAE